MNTKVKKALLYTGIGLDAAITVFLLIIAIIMLATLGRLDDIWLAYKTDYANEIINTNGPFIGYLQVHTTLYFWTCVFPLILLLIANIVGLVIYVKKVGNHKAELSDLTEEQRAALRAELLKDIAKEESKSNVEFSEENKEEK